MALGVTVAALLLAGVAIAISRGDGGSDQVSSAHGGLSTTTTPMATTTAAVATSVTPTLVPPTSSSTSQVTTTTRQPTTTTRPPTTTTAPCRNSMNPACGPLVYDPPPAANQPLTVEVTFLPPIPKVGDVVAFYAVAVDPDAGIIRDANIVERYSDGRVGTWPIATASCVGRFGPWDPPPPGRPDRVEKTFTHVFTTSGTHTATFGFSSSVGCEDPYAGRGEMTVTVIVTL